jgi:hypothetical protein
MYGFDFGGLDGIAGVEGISSPAIGAAAEGASSGGAGFNWAGLGERLGNVSSALQGGPADAVTARNKAHALDQQKADNQMKLGMLEESGRNDRQAQQLKQELMAHNERIGMEQKKLEEEQYQHQIAAEQAALTNALKQKELDMDAPVKKAHADFYGAEGQKMAAAAAEQAAATTALNQEVEDPDAQPAYNYPNFPEVSGFTTAKTTMRDLINRKRSQFAPDREFSPDKVANAELLRDLGEVLRQGGGGRISTATPTTPAPAGKGGW